MVPSQSKMFIKEPRILLRDLKNRSSQQVRTITGLLTGHGHLQKHLHTIEVSDTPMCRKYREIETTKYHFLCECNSIAILRLSVMGKFFSYQEDIRNMNIIYIQRTTRQLGIFLRD